MDPDLFHVPAHDGKGFILSELSRPQGGYGIMVLRITGEMESSQTFDSHNKSFAKEIEDLGNGISGDFFPVSIGQAERRPADWAGVGLGMEAAIRRIFIFAPADRTHDEGCHRSLVTIIGNVLDDRESGPAQSAIDKRITIPEVPRRK
jgi:hypothetical protein